MYPFYHPVIFSPETTFNAQLIAVLPFLCFDTIAILAEDVRCSERIVGELLQSRQPGLGNVAASNNACYRLADQVGGPGFRLLAHSSVLSGAPP